MISIKNKKECSGCSACTQACTHGAISMVADKTGFLYPEIDAKKCVECGRCDTVCPMFKGAFERAPTHVYALKHRNLDTRLKSASGGAFSVLAEKILESGGVVYGAAFDSHWDVVHVRVDDIAGLVRVRGSKYAQSKVGESFLGVRNDLQDGRLVLFSGTPCQVAALNLFVGYRNPLCKNLITVELVCCGVSNPRIWHDYVQEFSQEVGISSDDIASISFRDKTDGWLDYRFTVKANGVEEPRISTSRWKEPYIQLFLGDYINRPSCHVCAFKNGRSGADYTIADFWGIDVVRPGFYDKNGVSLLMAYNRESLDWLQGRAEIFETTYADACKFNPCVKRSQLTGRTLNLFYLFHDCFSMSVARAYHWSRPFAALENRFRKKAGRVFLGARTLVKHLLGV